MSHENRRYRAHIPDGSHALFDELVTDLDQLDATLEIVQAKEKFGELRVYLKASKPGATDLIDAATGQSKRMCQVCGSDAILRVTQGLYQTLRENHRGRSVPARKEPIVARFRLNADGLKPINLSSPGERTQ